MIIEYLGHSAFLFKGEDFSVVTDPFSGIGYDVKRVKCDYALSSHAHFDHNYFDGVDADRNVTETECGFTAIPCWHDEVKGGKRGCNNAFYFELDGLKVLHLGDIGQPYSEVADLFKLDVDVLLVPVGGNYTIDADEAVRYANGIGARLSVAMHYKTKSSKIDIDAPDRFMSLTGGRWLENCFEITVENAASFPRFAAVRFD